MLFNLCISRYKNKHCLLNNKKVELKFQKKPSALLQGQYFLLFSAKTNKKKNTNALYQNKKQLLSEDVPNQNETPIATVSLKTIKRSYLELKRFLFEEEAIVLYCPFCTFIGAGKYSKSFYINFFTHINHHLVRMICFVTYFCLPDNRLLNIK